MHNTLVQKWERMSLQEQNINYYFFVICHTLHCERIFTEDTFELDISTNLSTNISAPHHICAFHYWQSSFIRNILDCQLSDETSSVNTESWSLTDSSYQTPLNINIKSRNLPAKYSKYWASCSQCCVVVVTLENFSFLHYLCKICLWWKVLFA